MRIHSLMHVPFEDAASIGVWAQERGHSLNYTHLYHGQTLPPLESFEMLAIMGGLMNINEHRNYPWLAEEKAFIKKAIEAGKKVIGVCLGGQLIADVLGGKVVQNPNIEIGWFPVTLNENAKQSPFFKTLPQTLDAFHWHGDTFSIPPGAVHLASSDGCANQAFQYGDNVLGLQFHMEYSAESIDKMLIHCADEMTDAPFIQDAETIRAGYEKIPTITSFLFNVLDAFKA